MAIWQIWRLRGWFEYVNQALLTPKNPSPPFFGSTAGSAASASLTGAAGAAGLAARALLVVLRFLERVITCFGRIPKLLARALRVIEAILN